jgi:hypothetical protein
MGLADSSIAITAGSGETVATSTISGKKHQVVMLADANGYIQGSKPTWVVQSGNTANVAAATTTHIDLFNAAGSGVILVVEAIYIIPTLAAVTGLGLTWNIVRTNAVGTGGSTVTPRPMDTANTALPGGVTARLKPTGGATTNYILLSPNGSSEETSPYAGMASTLNHIGGLFSPWLQGIHCREGEGIKIDQTTNSNVGSTNTVIVFTTE